MRYGIIGSSGRMGMEIESLFQEKGHEIVLRLDDKGVERISTPQILIDFSLPAALEKTVELLHEYKCPLVTGVTGYSSEQNEQIKALGKEVAVVQSFNFSIGIHLMLKMTRLLNDTLSDWDVEISETHHRFKKDKPSGTAKTLAALFDREITVNSSRLGNIPGDHTVTFGGLGEILSLSHRVLSRHTFAEGALLAAKFALQRPAGYYTFSDVLSQSN